MRNKNKGTHCFAMIGLVIVLLLCSVVAVSAASHNVGAKNVTSCAYLADGAVYQANKPAGIWGTAPAGTVIKAGLYKDKAVVAESSATATNGKWELTLPGQEGSYQEYTIKLSVDGTEVAEYTGILFGEVWLASGQSNMQLKVCDSYEAKKLMEEADDSYLRIFQTEAQPTTGYTSPAADVNGEWLVGDTGRLIGRTSAVAYNFALKLRDELDVPVAIMEASLGGTPIETWISKEMVNTNAELRAEMERIGVYKTEALSHKELGAMYNSKIAPLSHTSIAGVIWYQGESNVRQASIYATQLDLLKEKWGEAFGYENDSMPFVFTQLAPYTFAYSEDQMLLTGMMDQMSSFYKAHEATAGMVTNYDLSLRYMDALPTTGRAVIHPTVKQPVGERMALSALGLVYGKKEATAPVLSSCEIVDGVAVLTFSHVGDGLTVVDKSVDALGFALCGENGVWVNATAEIINDNTVFVYSNMVKTPVHVSYAYCDMNTDANLCASNGIPVAPFSTGGNGGFGSRSYLNCDKELFIVTSFEVVDNVNGKAEYESLWTIKNRSELNFDNTYCKQGIASVKVDYEAGTGEVVAGMDLQQAGAYSSTIGLQNIKKLSVKMSNADAREKEIRLAVKSKDGTILLSKPQTLQADADFATLVFDFKTWYRDSGVQEPYPQKLVSEMVGLSFYIADAEAGTVWIDDIKLGLDEHWEPDLEAIMSKLGLEREYISEVKKDVRGGAKALPMELIIGISAAVVVLTIIVIFVVVIRKKKRNPSAE